VSETLYRNTEYFKAFPNPEGVFEQDRLAQHIDHLLPLATVDLQRINPAWKGDIHFVAPIEPYDGVVGECTEAHHSYLCRENWVGYNIVDGKYSLASDFKFFDASNLTDHYHHTRENFTKRARQFEQLGCLFHANSDGGASNNPADKLALVYDLGGESTDGNWANMGLFPISHERKHSDPEYGSSPLPLTEDGRLFSYIGSMSIYNYVAATCDFGWTHCADLVLFYDPQDNIALTTFDWS